MKSKPHYPEYSTVLAKAYSKARQKSNYHSDKENAKPAVAAAAVYPHSKTESPEPHPYITPLKDQNHNYNQPKSLRHHDKRSYIKIHKQPLGSLHDHLNNNNNIYNPDAQISSTVLKYENPSYLPVSHRKPKSNRNKSNYPPAANIQVSLKSINDHRQHNSKNVSARKQSSACLEPEEREYSMPRYTGPNLTTAKKNRSISITEEDRAQHEKENQHYTNISKKSGAYPYRSIELPSLYSDQKRIQNNKSASSRKEQNSSKPVKRSIVNLMTSSDSEAVAEQSFQTLNKAAIVVNLDSKKHTRQLRQKRSLQTEPSDTREDLSKRLDTGMRSCIIENEKITRKLQSLLQPKISGQKQNNSNDNNRSLDEECRKLAGLTRKYSCLRRDLSNVEAYLLTLSIAVPHKL